MHTYLDECGLPRSVFSQHNDNLRVGEASLIHGQLELFAELLLHVGIRVSDDRSIFLNNFSLSQLAIAERVKA